MSNALIPTRPDSLPVLVAASGDRAGMRFLEFFASAIRNPHTRRAYARAAGDFLTWCADAGVMSITAVRPLHVATWIELQTQTLSTPTVKQRLAAIRHLFDWLVIGQIVLHNLRREEDHIGDFFTARHDSHAERRLPITCAFGIKLACATSRQACLFKMERLQPARRTGCWSARTRARPTGGSARN